jgi:transmembrane sensor
MALDFRTKPTPESAAEQAATWLVEFESGPLPETQRRIFVAWLKRSPVHVEEFLQLSALHREIARSPAFQASLEETLAEARDTVVSLDESRVPPSPVVAKAPRRPRWRAVAAGVLVLVTGALATALFYEPGVYRTGVGEQRSIALADGSVILLNTQSEIRVTLGEERRRVTLVDGEAMFDVARDPARPFLVDAGATAIRVLGTRFNVYRQRDKTTVTVIEGRVRVEEPKPSATESTHKPQATNHKPQTTGHKPQAAQRTTTLTTGQQVVVALGGDILQPPQVDLTRAIAWTERRVIFDDAPLSEVAVEFNRYNRRQLVLDDLRLAAREVTGVFQVHDLDVLVAFLQGQEDIRVTRDGETLRIVPETGYSRAL